MVDENDKKDEKFEFDAAGEAPVYISLEQAALLAIEVARDEPADSGERFQDVPMAFDIEDQIEGEDYYTITLSFAPEGDFTGRPGREQFFIAKEGRIAHRQLRRRPRRAGEWPLPPTPVLIGVAAAIGVGVLALVGVVLFAGDDGAGPGGQTPVSAPVSQAEPGETPTPMSETPVPAVAQTAASPTAAPTFVPLQTGRFETAGTKQPSGWTFDNTGVASTADVVGGTRRFDSVSVRLQVSSIPRFSAQVRQDVAVSPGQVWSIAAWGLRMDPFTGADLRLEWLDDGLQTLETVTQGFSAGARWDYASINNQTAPPRAAWLRFSVRCESSAISPCGETFVDGAVACDCKSAPSFPTAKNVLQNPSFEVGKE